MKSTAAIKVGILYDNYMPFHEVKDPGLITLGLDRMGCDAVLITESKDELIGYEPPFALLTVEKKKFTEVEFWRRVNADVIICYSWLDPAYNSVVTAIHESGKRIVVKSDRDGRLGYPVTPRDPRLWRTPIPSFLGRLWLEYRKTAIANRIAEQVAQQVGFADAVIIESPKARDNLCRFFSHWGKSDLAPKVKFIPNPVADDISTGIVRTKQNVAISVGRWEDPIKNAPLLLRSMGQFLKANPQWRLRVVGDGERTLDQAVSAWRSELREKVEILGQVPHSKIVELLADSRVLFMPSRSEASPLAAAEAVCMGCTIVGTPLESLEFLVADGFSGTLSDSFSLRDLVRALRVDVSKHAEDFYHPTEIADYWRPKLSATRIATQIHEC